MAIRIDNSEAKAKFAETKEQIAAVRAEMDKLAAEGKKSSDEYKALKQRQDELNKSLAEYRKEGVQTALSYAELRKGASQLKREMDKAVPGTEKWKALRQDYLLTNQRMKELSVQAQDTRFSLSKLTDGFNKYAAIGTSVVASLTGVVLTARRCVDEYAKMQEAESQVIKYTGMTKEEVADLNEEFKRMDTRTPRERLNALAGDAGRLGISAKKDVLEFVDAANQINVALGEDLGEDAVKNIGKLSQMFGDESRTLRENMLAIGSAVNSVAQNSSAAEPYLVEFTARMGGVAKQAKMSITDVMGFASALDQNMLRSEMSSTALQGLILKLYQEPAKYAKLAKMDVKEFTELIGTDMNEALLRFLESLGKLGGMDNMAPVLKEMKLSGAEAAGVISALAGNVERVRKEQKTANDAFREGTSITNEYNVQNNTVQAGLDKAKERFKNIRVELGEKLLPVMRYMISTGSLTVKGLSTLISILFEYKTVILTSVTAVMAYTAAKQLQWFWLNKVKTETGQYIVVQKLKQFWDKAVAASTWLYIAATSALTGRTQQAGLAMQAFFKILKLNPFVSIATLLVSVGGALYFFSRRASEARRAQMLLNSVTNEAKSQILSEKTEVESLLKVARDDTRAKEERLKAIKRLNDISPEYLGGLNLEKIATKDATKAVDKYIESLLTLVEVESVKSRLTDTDKQLSELKDKQQKYLDERNSFWGAVKSLPRNIGSMLTFGGVENVGEKLSKDIVELEQQREHLKTLLESLVREQVVDVNTETEDDGTGGAGGTGDGTDDDKRPWNTRLQAVENAYQEELLLLRKKSDSLAQTENEYQLDALQKEQEYQAKRLAIIKHYQSVDEDKKHLAELGKLEIETQTNIYNSLKKTEDTRLSLLKEYRDRRMQTVQDGEKKLQHEQVRLYEMGELQEKDYKNRILAIDVSSLYSRLEIAKGYQADVADMELLNGEVKANAVKEAGDTVLALEKEISEKRTEIVQSSANQIAAFNNRYSKMNTLATSEQQLSALKDFYTSQLNLAQKFGLDTTLLTATYEAAKDKIEKKGAEERAKVVQKYGLDTAESTKSMRLKALEEEHQKGLLSEEEYQVSKNKIENQYLQEKIEKNEAYFNAVSNIMGSVSSAIQGFQDAEVNKITRKYDKQIAVAKKAGKDTTKLEEEKEEAINQVKKKYADKQFAASVLQVTASTAVAAMEAYKAMAGIPIVGPALGTAAAAAAVASGAAQIAVAKQQRDEAKGLKSGGYSDDYVEGYTKSGNPDDVAGVIPVHKNEFVTNHEGVANPHVRQFLDVFDVAQKNGTIRMLNTTQILEQVRTRSGKYSGGYNSEEVDSSSQSFAGSSSGLTPELRSQIVNLLRKTNELLVAIRDKDLIVDPRKVRDAIKRVEQLESNVTR